MIESKSYRSVPMVPTSAMAAAARYVEREWGSEGYWLGFAGDVSLGKFAFQVCARDGSRFLVWADRFENVGQFDNEAEVARELDVEVN
jgi:hypothetical protein